ncbi:MAG: tetratricopeptide repeat protein [Microcystis aeruginosa LL13-06]|nr:tetratricopeptide repeat protein [Microcystis aeruginosa LL13-06]
MYQSQGRYPEAEPLYLEALDLYKRLLGDNHPLVATSLNNLAGLYDSQGRYPEAEPLYLQALAIAEQALGENHPNTIIFRENYNICLRRGG